MADTRHFDEAAATWDQEDRRVALARGVARAIRERVPLEASWEVLDFGCGTGLVALELGPHVGGLTGADTSAGMLETLGEKARAQGRAVGLLHLDPAAPLALGGPYDLVASSMTLHHVEDVPGLFRDLARHLRPGGWVALADLDTEDGSFHGDNAGVHHLGFPREDVRAWLEAAGLAEVAVETALVTAKEGKDYPVFLATARKGR